MKKKQIINITLFIIYISCLLYLTLFKNYLGRTVGNYEANLIPFKNIYIIITEFIKSKVSLRFFLRNIFGNLIAFMPFAYFLPSIFKISSKKKFTIITFLIILFIETMQFNLKMGYFDIDDIILNLIGAYLAFIIIDKYIKGENYGRY